MEQHKTIKSQMKINDIAPLQASDWVDDIDPDLDINKYLHFLNQNADTLGTFKKYLPCKLHNSWVTDFEINPKKLRIAMNDFSTHVFADAIIERKNLKINHDLLVFPVNIELQGNVESVAYTVDEDGTVHEMELPSIDEYLGEQIVELDDTHVKIVFQLWRSAKAHETFGERIAVVAYADRMVFIEKQDEAWKHVFGNKYAAYYQYYKKQFYSGRYVSDYGICLEIVDEYDRYKHEHNLN